MPSIRLSVAAHSFLCRTPRANDQAGCRWLLFAGHHREIRFGRRRRRTCRCWLGDHHGRAGDNHGRCLKQEFRRHLDYGQQVVDGRGRSSPALTDSQRGIGLPVLGETTSVAAGWSPGQHMQRELAIRVDQGEGRMPDLEPSTENADAPVLVGDRDGPGPSGAASGCHATSPGRGSALAGVPLASTGAERPGCATVLENSFSSETMTVSPVFGCFAIKQLSKFIGQYGRIHVTPDSRAACLHGVRRPTT